MNNYGYAEFLLPKYFKVGRSHLVYMSDSKYFGAKYVKKMARKIIRFYKAKKHIDFNDCFLPANKLEISNNAYYEGYFQSVAFFELQKEKIKRKFSIREKYTKLFKEKYGKLFAENKILVINIRRAEYVAIAPDYLGGQTVSLPISYYTKCLDKIENLENYKIIVTGDDMEFGKQHFSYLPNVSFEENEKEKIMIDFQLLMNADVSIISNSTFAWWAAYLNNKKEKIVYAPKYWLGYHIKKEFPIGISYNLPYFWEEI